jgi:hypothetical protein
LGKVEDKAEVFERFLEFVCNLKSLVEHPFSADNDKAQKIEDNYKKGLHKEPKFLALA